MPTNLGPEFKPDFAGFPPHMPGMDLVLWRRFRKEGLEGAIRLYFDVGLGQGRPTGNVTDPALRRMWEKNTQKRADVIIEEPNRVRIVELRTKATPSAIGRLLTYGQLWKDDDPIGKPMVLELVTDEPDPDVEKVANKMGIIFTLV